MPRSTARPIFDVVVSAQAEVGSPDWKVCMDTARRGADNCRIKAKKGQKNRVIVWNERLFLHFVTGDQREKYIASLRILKRFGMPISFFRSNNIERQRRAREAARVAMRPAAVTRKRLPAKKQKRARG